MVEFDAARSTRRSGPDPDVGGDPQGDRLAGWLLGISSAVIAFLILAHPVLRPQASGDAAAEIGRMAGAPAFVHGALVVLLTLLTIELTRLTWLLGAVSIAVAAADRLQTFAWIVLASVGILAGHTRDDLGRIELLALRRFLPPHQRRAGK